MKRNIVFFVFLLTGMLLRAQGIPCFSLNMQIAQKEYGMQLYDKARLHFQKAAGCPDADTLLTREWIARCDEAIAHPPIDTMAAVAVEQEPVDTLPTSVPMVAEETQARTETMTETKVETTPQAEEETPETSPIVVPAVVPATEENAYMQIREIQYANFNNDLYLNDYGEKLFASDMRFLTFRIHYDGLETSLRHTIHFLLKMTDEHGHLITGRQAPEGYTAEYDMEVLPGKDRVEEFGCRGRSDTSIYKPGRYTMALYYRDTLLCQDTLTLHAKPGEATFLAVDGHYEDYTHTIHAGGERRVYTVATDANHYRLEGLKERWVTVEYLPDNQFALTFKPDYAAILTPFTFWVTTGNLTIRTDVEYTRDDDALYNRVWEALLTKNMDVYDNQLDLGIRYKGQHGKRNKSEGFGIYKWEDNAFYYGQFHDDHREGKALYFIPLSHQTIGGEVYYVGPFKNSLRTGEGRSYDAYGHLIYEGNYLLDRPQGKLPMVCNPDYRFVCQKYSNGSYYLGETYQGKRHGYGMMIQPNGDLWCGEWADDQPLQGFQSIHNLNGIVETPYRN